MATPTPAQWRPYGEGLDAAVACPRLPQSTTWTAPPRSVASSTPHGARRASGLASRRLRAVHRAGVRVIDWQALDSCTGLASRAAGATPPVRPYLPSGGYPDVPVLVLAGELDAIAAPAEATLVVEQFPYARQVLVRNSSTSLRSATPTTARSGSSGAGSTRTVSSSHLSCRPATATSRPCARSAWPEERQAQAIPRQVAPAAAADGRRPPDRWWNNCSGHGVGLRSGTWRYSGSDRSASRWTGAADPRLSVSGAPSATATAAR